MLFDTLAEYDAEIEATRADLAKARQMQSMGAGGGTQIQRGRVQEMVDYLRLLSKERELVQARTQGGTVTRAYFGSAS